jgi:hypothetical protein
MQGILRALKSEKIVKIELCQIPEAISDTEVRLIDTVSIVLTRTWGLQRIRNAYLPLEEGQEIDGDQIDSIVGRLSDELDHIFDFDPSLKI